MESKFSGHGKVVCGMCFKIIAQCRCMKGHNKITYSTCKDDKKKRKMSPMPNNLPRIVVMNRNQIEVNQIALTEPYVIISISCPNDQANPNINKFCKATLYIQADDIEKEVVIFGDQRAKLFSKEDARRILEFYNEYKGQVKRIIVHCDAGISRSPAVAAALYRVEGRMDDNWFKHYHPNRRVYSLILAEHFEVSDAK
jgi:predicted protein tyrosine phosphatase